MEVETNVWTFVVYGGDVFYLYHVFVCVCVLLVMCDPVCVFMCVSFLPESWSCFPGHPQGVPLDSSCQPSGTSPEHEPSPMSGSLGAPPPLAYGTHTNTYTHAQHTSSLSAFNRPPPVKSNTPATSNSQAVDSLCCCRWREGVVKTRTPILVGGRWLHQLKQ